MSRHNELGRWGEMVAKEYLTTHGHAITHQNTRIAKIEIDLITRIENYICFVEVKTRSTDIVDPADAVDMHKRRRMIHAADLYMRSVNEPLEPRFDLIFIIGNPDKYTIEYIPDAFYPV